MTDPPLPDGDLGVRVPGLVPVSLVSRGRRGALWRCRETATGGTVAVRVGCRPAGPLAEAAAAREVRLVSALRGVDSPHVVRLRRVVDLPGGRRALVSDWVPGDDLAQVMASDQVLEVGAAVTVGVGVARGLAALHGCGVAHGSLHPGCVRFGPAGRPVLVDAGVSRLLAPLAGAGGGGGVGAGAAADVGALGDLLDLLATVPRWQHDVSRLGLAAVADACRDPQEADRPDPAEVARRVWAVATAAPVPGVGRPAPSEPMPAATPGPPVGGPGVRRGVLAGGVLVTAAAVAAAAVVVTGVGTSGSGGAFPPDASAHPPGRSVAAVGAPAGVPAVQADHFGGVVERLARARPAALSGAGAGLAPVDEPGSPAWAADAGVLRALARHRLRLEQLRFEVDAVRVVSRRRERGREVVTVQCTVAVLAHVRVAAGPRSSGSVGSDQVERVPAQAPRPVRLVLVGAAGRWLVRAVA